MDLWSGRGIGRRAFLEIMGFSLALTILAAGGYVLLKERDKSLQLEEEVRLTVAAQTPAIVSALWNLDQVQVHALVEGLKSYPYISYVTVSGKLGGGYAAGELRLDEALRVAPLIHDSGSRRDDLGLLEFQVDRRRMVADVVAEIRGVLVFWILILFVQSLFIALLFRRTVTTHLVKAAGYFRSFGATGESPPLVLDKPRRGDELDLLAASFNSLALRLSETSRNKDRALADLRESEERFRSLVENAPDAILIYDPEAGHFTDCNGPAERLFRLDRKAILGLDPEGLYRAVGLDDLEVLADVRASVARSIEEGSLLLRRAFPDGLGGLIECEVRVTPFMLRGRRALRSSYLDVTDRVRAEAALRTSLREKEVLLQEVYHRTKNNMQVITALLDLRAEEVAAPEAREVLLEMVGRIYSMALVHEKLYRSQDLSRIDLGEYTRDLVAHIRSGQAMAAGGPTIAVEVDPGLFALIDIAIPCGLALNELLTNALRHGCGEGGGSAVMVRLWRPEPGWLELSVSDDGPGLPEGFDFRVDGHMGIQTVLSLVESQLHGRVDARCEGGLRWMLRFRDDLYERRV